MTIQPGEDPKPSTLLRLGLARWCLTCAPNGVQTLLERGTGLLVISVQGAHRKGKRGTREQDHQRDSGSHQKQSLPSCEVSRSYAGLLAIGRDQQDADLAWYVENEHLGEDSARTLLHITVAMTATE